MREEGLNEGRRGKGFKVRKGSSVNGWKEG